MTKRVRWGWLLLALTSVLFVVLALGHRTGNCLDAPAESAAASTCSTSPTLGVGGALVFSLGGTGLAVYSLRRAFRRDRGD